MVYLHWRGSAYLQESHQPFLRVKHYTVADNYCLLPRYMIVRRDFSRQLFWIVGKNPFGQSYIWGEGSNYPQLYNALPGETVGEIPVGMQTRANEDKPYWPQFNTATYKEVWGSSAARWFSLISEF